MCHVQGNRTALVLEKQVINIDRKTRQQFRGEYFAAAEILSQVEMLLVGVQFQQRDSRIARIDDSVFGDPRCGVFASLFNPISFRIIFTDDFHGQVSVHLKLVRAADRMFRQHEH